MKTSENHKEQLNKIREKIESIDVAMLTTQDREEHLNSRPMQTLKMEDDGTLWFFTKSQSPKNKEISSHHDVNLSYADSKTNRYVSITGEAEIVENEKMNKKLWDPAYKAWFPAGLEDPDLRLLKVKMHTAEYWDNTSSEMVRLFKVVDAILSGEHYKAGENVKISDQP
jgi:general stress protein 26